MSKKTTSPAAAPSFAAGESEKKIYHKRFRWLEMKLYPENPYHVLLLEHLRAVKQHQGVHILHDKDGVKPHYHVVLYSSTHQYNGVEVGGGRFLLKTFASSFGCYDAIVDKSGKPAVILPPTGGRDGFPESLNKFNIKSFPVVSDVAGINNPSQFLLYLTHSDFNSMISGKHRYNFDDLVIWENSPTIREFLTNSVELNSSLLREIVEISQEAGNGRTLIDLLVSMNRWDLVEYVRKNPQFVSQFLIKR